MTDFEPKGTLSDSAKIRNRLDEIEQYRSSGHSLINIYRGLKESGVITCGYTNFKRVYYDQRNLPAETTAETTESTNNSTDEVTANDSSDNIDLGNEPKQATPPGFDSSAADKPAGKRMDMLGSFDRNAAIAQAKATFRENRRDK